MRCAMTSPFPSPLSIQAVCFAAVRLNTRDRSPSSPAGHLFMTLRHESLLAEELDPLPRVRARLAERDPAVLSQLELLALPHHFQLAGGGDEGAVRAVGPQHEPVLGPLAGAIL